MTKTRLEMIKKKRCAMEKYLKIDIADLLQNGLDSNAYSRVIFLSTSVSIYHSCVNCTRLLHDIAIKHT